MRVVSKKALRIFWESRKADSRIAERDLLAWLKAAEPSAWANFAALKQTFGSADQVGNCVVFDVGSNRYRLIGRVNYRAGKVYVLAVMDHGQYDRTPWAEACGCYDPPPRAVPPKTAQPPRNRPSKGDER